jgi:3-(3-hydroxy-phenyl)propionate hydroxylase
MADLAARGHQPITGDLVKLGPGLWCADTLGAGELSPQGIVSLGGRRDRFDQVIGQGWMVIAVDRPTDGLLSAAQGEALDRLNGRLLSIGRDGSGCDVVAEDSAYADWMAQVDANYAILRPDFYVAATARTPEHLSACFDTLIERLGLSKESAVVQTTPA